MRAVFSDRGRLQGMLDFEAALARAEARAGVIPAAAVAPIEAQCRADAVRRRRARARHRAGRQCRDSDGQSAHRAGCRRGRGRSALRPLGCDQPGRDGHGTRAAAARCARSHRSGSRSGSRACSLRSPGTHKRTVLVGRTWLQQATPVTFGLKAAGWLSAVERHRTRIRELRPRVLALQFGGAAGTLASLGEDGLRVATALAADLRLALPDVPWHAHRDRVAEVASALGLLVGTLGKIARDVSLLMQTEVAEAFEPAGAGKGGSSTMPHKRNPVSSAAILAAAIRVPGLVSVMLDRDGPGARARVRRLARGMGDAAGDLHARGRRAFAPHPAAGRNRARRRADAREPRGDAWADPRRGGDDGARRQDRPPPGASSRRAPRASARRSASGTCARC